MARDLGGLVAHSLQEEEIKQMDLESVLQERAPWGYNARYFRDDSQESKIMYQLARTGLTAFYQQRALQRANFHDRKAARSAALGNNRTFPYSHGRGIRI